MKIHPLAKILVSLIPGSGAPLQIISEIEAAIVEKRLSRLEDPLSRFGEELEPLCVLLASAIRESTTSSNRLPWSDDYTVFLKLLNRLEANGYVDGSPALFTRNSFERGIRLAPTFVVYLATYYGDPEMCVRMTESMDELVSGITGKRAQELIPLPLMVIDAFFTLYEREGQGMKSREGGSSHIYYCPR